MAEGALVARSERPAVASPSAPGQVVRLTGIDAARAVAILGMIAVHAIPRGDNAGADWIVRIAYGRASLLFVVLAGIGVGLLTRPAQSPRGSGVPSALLWRTPLLLVGGLALQLLDHDANVILPTYAALFVLAAIFVRASNTVLLATAIGSMLIGPVVWLVAQRGGQFTMEPPILGDPPVQVLGDVLATGPYPLVTWAGPFLLGIWLARMELSNPRLQRRLVLAGTGVAVAGLASSRVLTVLFGQPDDGAGMDRLLSAVGHSQMPLWLLSGSGSAFAVIGIALLTVARAPHWFYPAISLGRLSLTIYVAHLAGLALVARLGPGPPLEGPWLAALMGALALGLSSLWCALFPRGPLEALLRLPDLLHRSRKAG